jgi:hypothetical protein
VKAEEKRHKNVELSSTASEVCRGSTFMSGLPEKPSGRGVLDREPLRSIDTVENEMRETIVKIAFDSSCHSNISHLSPSIED